MRVIRYVTVSIQDEDGKPILSEGLKAEVRCRAGDRHPSLKYYANIIGTDMFRGFGENEVEAVLDLVRHRYGQI